MNQPSPDPAKPRLIGITSASGGLQALPEILGALPHDFPVPILLLPSINPDYVNWLAEHLEAKCSLKVTAAEDGQVPEPGHVYVAANEACMVVVQGRLRLECGDPDYQRRPKDALFRSMARELGSAALAVILTGLGADGAEGMKEVRDAGGHTIAQDRSTSLIYGPAKFAVELNAVCESLPLQEIAPRLVALAVAGPSNKPEIGPAP
jgi:two-component system, chemotaxis family, protein-glutamate methylesterase/glutaminase